MTAHVLEARPMLESHQSTRTSVREEAERVVARALNGHRLVDIGGDLDLVHNLARVGSLSLHYIDYGAELTILPQQAVERFFLVQVPLHGSMWLHSDRAHLEAEAGAAILSEVGRAHTIMGYSPHCSRLLVKIPSLLMHERQEALGVETTRGQIFPVPLLDVDTGPGRSWVDLLRSTITDLEAGTGLFSRAHAGRYFERLIVDGLLLSCADLRPMHEVTSRVVSVAADFIKAHLADPITVEDIAHATHLSVRALQDHFRKELSLSPMEYVRNCRLDAIHRNLKDGGRNATIATVASHYGMTHLGRFAAAYRARFGQSPSETLRGTATV